MKKVIIFTVTMLVAGLAALQAADAKENWEKHCAKCHGADGKGQTTMGKKVKAKDYTDAKVQASFTDDQAFKITKEGKKEGDKTVMKAYGEAISDQEIKDLVAFVRKFKK
jgi:cytochrome c553